MNTVYFMNDTEFDSDAMLTFGMSAKSSDDAIGFFGTGFKYAVAIILRHGGSVLVESCGDKYEFRKESKTVRGTEFELVTMNGQNAGFTTRLGINWEPWKAFRELWANCMDEGGTVSTNKDRCKTVISVTCPEIMLAYQTRDQFILTGNPIASTKHVDIHKKPRPYYFYRGFAVSGAPENAIYSYNINDHVSLTEDRTAQYSHQISFPIAKGVQSLKDRQLLRTILTAPTKSLERHIQYDHDWGVSDEFITEARECVASGVGISDAALRVLKSVDEKSGDWPEISLSAVQNEMLGKAQSFLNGIGIDSAMFPIKVVSGLGNGVMGRALHNTIYLSDIPFDQGTKQVASTLLEEWIHNKYGCEDFDRGMQSWLFDKVLSIGEELNGKPL